MFWIIICAILVSIGCWMALEYANASLFTYLGEADINGHMESCYTYDLMTVPARIVCFLFGVAAITIFCLTWCSVYSIIFM